MATWSCSVKSGVGGGGEHGHEVLFLEVGACDAELADLLRDHRLLPLDLEVELHVGLRHRLDGLGARLLASRLEIGD